MTRKLVLLVLASVLSCSVGALEVGDYKINSGDILEIFVWNEEALTREVIVRSDGYISIPLAGEFRAGGQTPIQLTEAITTALGKYLNDKPVVTVSLRAMDGNIVYILGKVNRPGAYTVAARVDVTQALAWAGGLNAFADENDIQILRRDDAGNQRAMPFNYSGVKSGEDLGTNIVLESGDIVIVP